MRKRLPWILATAGVLLTGSLAWRTRHSVEHTDAEVRALVAEAKDLFEHDGDVAGAVERLDRAIALRPDELHLYHRKGEVLTAAMRDQEALDTLEIAYEMDPDEWETHKHLMKVWGRLDMCDEAIQRVESFMVRHPDHAKSYYARGFCHFKEGRFEEALADVTRACELGHEPGCEMADSYGKPARVLSVDRKRLPN